MVVLESCLVAHHIDRTLYLAVHVRIVVLFRVRVRIRIVDIALDDVVDQTWAGIVVVDIDR